MSNSVQGNPYCNKRWTSEDDSQRCTFYCRQPCIYLSPSKNLIRNIINTVNTSRTINVTDSVFWSAYMHARLLALTYKSLHDFAESNNMGWKVITLATSISSAVVVLVILGFAVILRRKQKHIRDLQKSKYWYHQKYI